MPTSIRRVAGSNVMRDTNRSENPVLDVNQVLPKSPLRSTPAPSQPRRTAPPGSTRTLFTTSVFCVTSLQVTAPSSLAHSPSVVPAYRVSGRSGSWAKERVRRLLEGIPRILVKRAPPSKER